MGNLLNKAGLIKVWARIKEKFIDKNSINKANGVAGLNDLGRIDDDRLPFSIARELSTNINASYIFINTCTTAVPGGSLDIPAILKPKTNKTIHDVLNNASNEIPTINFIKMLYDDLEAKINNLQNNNP